MKTAKARRLKAAGWKVGSTKDFLRLNDQEAALVEVKLCLMDALRQARRKRGISQIDLAKRMGSSQSRIAKIEAGDPSVSLDLILRALVASGASRREIQKTLASGYPPAGTA
jgi:ribosome-binding protein aMBF1 (putative translation factor)